MYKKSTFKIESGMFPYWEGLIEEYTSIIGFTYFGDLFLMNTENQIGLLLTQKIEFHELPPTLNASEFFDSFLTEDKIVKAVLQPKKIRELENHIGVLSASEVYIPEPYLPIGGKGNIENYSKGDLMVYLSISSQTFEQLL